MKQHIMMDPEVGQWSCWAHSVSYPEAMQATYCGGHTGDGQASSGAKFLATTISTKAFFPREN
jgi:hypothetical protein